jgi:hypothetical protein
VAGILGAGIHHRAGIVRSRHSPLAGIHQGRHVLQAGIDHWQASSGGRRFRVAGILLHWVGGFQDIGFDKRPLIKNFYLTGGLPICYKRAERKTHEGRRLCGHS